MFSKRFFALGLNIVPKADNPLLLRAACLYDGTQLLADLTATYCHTAQVIVLPA